MIGRINHFLKVTSPYTRNPKAPNHKVQYKYQLEFRLYMQLKKNPVRYLGEKATSIVRSGTLK